MQKLIINGELFQIDNNKIVYLKVSNIYWYTNDTVEILQKIVEDTFDDYYLEKVYNHIKNLPGTTQLLEDCDRKYLDDNEDVELRFTDRIKIVIGRCCENPQKILENKILKLFTIGDIAWLPYVKKLNETLIKISVMDILSDDIYEEYITSNIFHYNYFTINFDKYHFSLRIEMDDIQKFKLAQKNIELIPNLDYQHYEIIPDSSGIQQVIDLYNQKYKVFDDVIKYIESLV